MSAASTMRLEERIMELLVGGFAYLAEQASRTGHWREVRSTSLAGMCMQLREPAGSPWIVAVREWLLSQQAGEGNAAGSWGEEVWDSAMCLLALRDLEVPLRDARLRRGVDWVGSLFSVNGRRNWHDEPWETCWALIALLRIGRVPAQVDVPGAVDWLAALQSPGGRIISSAYTAYFMLIVSLAEKSGAVLEGSFQESADRCVVHLLEEWRTAPPALLWGGEAWLNGQVLWALGSADRLPTERLELIEKAVTWFERTQEAAGNWSDIEDTASAILGLHRVLWALYRARTGEGRSIRELDDMVENRVRRAVPLPPLRIRRQFVEREVETGYVSLNLRESTVRLTATIIAFLIVGVLGWIADLMSLLQSLRT